MIVALRSPRLVGTLVSVDNAPVDATLKSDFGRYIQAMRRIEEAQLTKQSEADDLLKQYEEVGLVSIVSNSGRRSNPGNRS